MHCRFLLRLITAVLGMSCLALYSCEKDEPITPTSVQQTIPAAEVYANMNDILLESLQDPVVRNFIRTEALKRVTYDYEVVYGMVKHVPMTDGRTLEQAFLSTEAELITAGRLTGAVVKDLQSVTPLLSINVPVGIFDWNTEEYAPAVVLDPEANKRENGSVDGYFADGRSQTFQAGQAHEYPVVTLADNERMLYRDGAYELDQSLYLFVAPATKMQDNSMSYKDETEIIPPGGGGGGGGGGGSGYDNCNRQFGHYVDLTALSMNDVSDFETFGRPELRLNILGGAGVYLAQQGSGDRVVDVFYNPDREDVKQRRWDNFRDFLFMWKSDYGHCLTFRWDEEDDGQMMEVTEFINVILQNESYHVMAPVFLSNRSEHIHTEVVFLDGCPPSHYGDIDLIRWRLDFTDVP